jgi:hypothetical protein
MQHAATEMGSEDYCLGMALEFKAFLPKIVNIFSQEHFYRDL